MDPEPQQAPEMTLTEAVGDLMQDLPKPVRDFLVSDTRAEVVTDLSAKYGLHVDQAGDFEQAFLFMLLGTYSPEDFVNALRTAGLPQDVVNGLVSDVNERVFIPLRDAEQNPQPEVPQKPEPLPTPALEYAPAAPVLPGSGVPVPAPETAAPLPVVSQPAPLPVVTAEPQPIVPVAHPVQPMPSVAQPGWHPAAAVHVYVPTHPAAHQPVPQPVFVPSAPVPEASASVVAAPVVEPAPFVPSTPKPVVSVPSAPTPAPVAPSVPATPASPLAKEYAADPYREPI